MLHPVNRLSTHCITSMATLLLSCRSSQEGRVTLYTDVPVTDQPLVADSTSTYMTTLPATEIRTQIVATLTPFPQGILHLVLPVDFMQEEEATISLPLMSRYSTKQPLRTRRKDCHRSSIYCLIRSPYLECYGLMKMLTPVPYVFKYYSNYRLK